MNIRRAVIAGALVLAACAGPESRIKKHRAAYDAWPPAVQTAVRDGRAEVGFTREQVETALGRPERVYSRKTADAEQEIWAYGARGARPSVGLGFGVGSGGFGGGVGLGVGTDDSAWRDERERVVFAGGVVVSVEKRDR